MKTPDSKRNFSVRRRIPPASFRRVYTFFTYSPRFAAPSNTFSRSDAPEVRPLPLCLPFRRNVDFSRVRNCNAPLRPLFRIGFPIAVPPPPKPFPTPLYRGFLIRTAKDKNFLSQKLPPQKSSESPFDCRPVFSFHICNNGKRWGEAIYRLTQIFFVSSAALNPTCKLLANLD